MMPPGHDMFLTPAILLALALCVLFGVLDVQCIGNASGNSWNAIDQVCE